MAFTFEGKNQGIGYTVDNTNATFSLEVTGVKPYEKEHSERLHPNYIEAMKTSGKFDAPLLPSIDMIRGKGKQFDDGLYAAIELGLADGLGNIKDGKVEFLKEVYSKIKDYRDISDEGVAGACDEALAYVAGGLKLLEESVDTDSVVGAKVSEKLSEFNGDPVKSKPLGFYTWTENLGRIFKCDRFYQGILDIENDTDTRAAIVMSQVIYSDPSLREQHDSIMSLYGKLTNPASSLSLGEYFDVLSSMDESARELLSSDISGFMSALKKTDAYRAQAEKAPGDVRKIGCALFPHSYSKETDLFNKTQAVYETGDLMNQLINGIVSGKIALEPREDSGWYDHQLYALETLLVPEKGEESKKLSIGEKYKKRLVEAFKTMITKARETHIKTLEIGTTLRCAVVERKPIEIKPKFDAEPISTIYKRNALGYAFLKKALGDVLGEDALSGIYRLREDGSRADVSVAEELDFMTDLMYGFYKVTCDNLGFETRTALPHEYLEEAESVARQWMDEMEDDVDLTRDTRVIVPVQQMKTPGFGGVEIANWATMGVKLLKVSLRYEKDPEVTLHLRGEDVPVKMHDGRGYAKGMDVKLKPIEYTIPVDEFREIITNKPLTRAEWRNICDQYKTADEIAAAVEGKTATAYGVPASEVKSKLEETGLREKTETVFDAAKGLSPEGAEELLQYVKRGFRGGKRKGL